MLRDAALNSSLLSPAAIPLDRSQGNRLLLLLVSSTDLLQWEKALPREAIPVRLRTFSNIADLPSRLVLPSPIVSRSRESRHLVKSLSSNNSSVDLP